MSYLLSNLNVREIFFIIVERKLISYYLLSKAKRNCNRSLEMFYSTHQSMKTFIEVEKVFYGTVTLTFYEKSV